MVGHFLEYDEKIFCRGYGKGTKVVRRGAWKDVA